MGRVYKALVRADRAGIGERKIGRPEPDRTPVPMRRSVTIAPAITRTTSALPSIAQTLHQASEKPARATQLQTVQIKLDANPLSELAVIHKPKSFEEPLEILDIRELPHDPLLSIQIREDVGAIEQYQSLAARLLSFTDQRKVKTVLITSAEPGEGKTNVAVGAAWAAATLSKNRVLLLDANPDNPSVAGLLGINPTNGWSNLIDHSCEAKQALVRIDPNGLYVLTPGQSAGGFDVMSASFQEMIADVACNFDLVIVDSPAILESACTQRLVETLDGTVVVARSASTHRDKVSAARKLIPKQRRLGVVLNQIEPGLVGKRGRKSMFGRLFGRR
jgi:protein-tyrosine kinase